MLTGENGILTQAQRAKGETQNATINEANILSSYEDYINNEIRDVPQVNDSNPGTLEGSGTEQDPYTINSIEDLVFFADNVTKGNTYKNQYVKLNQSLDFKSDKSYIDPNREDYYGYDGKLKEALTSGNGFKPIGKAYGDETGEHNFNGIFDGNNKNIINLFIKCEFNDTRERCGLFNYNYGNIKNVILLGANITVTNGEFGSVGYVSGQNRENCIIENCLVTGNMNINGNGLSTGGIVSSNYKGTINKCFVDGEIHGNGNINIGGIVCNNSGNIEECYNKSNIFNTSDNNGASGIVDNNNGRIEKCYNTGNINIKINNGPKANAITLGGIAEYSNSGASVIISKCYNAGNLKVIINDKENTDYELQVGGIVGSSETETSNCYNTGSIEISNNISKTYVGGILGKSFSGTSIKNSYNVGNINAVNNSNLFIGGIAGALKQNISNCYYINQDDFNNIDKENVGIVKTSEEMKKNDFVNLLNSNLEETTWKEDGNNINNGYPILIWQ